MGDALRHWQEQLAAWAIPERFTAAVADSPWTLPTEVFAKRADLYVAEPVGASWRRALEALGPDGGVVLDVGAGAGAASLPLARQASALIAVDSSPSMMTALTERASRLGLPVRTFVGRWPDIADEVPAADVVVCHNVFYNVPDLDAFAVALTTHARRRVVVELTPAHPLRGLNPLWRLLHELDRPDGPTASDAQRVLQGLPVHPHEIHPHEIHPHEERWPRPPRHRYDSFDDLIATTRRRLCLPPSRDEELAAALIGLGVDPQHPRDLGGPGDELVTIWWDVETFEKRA